MIKYPLDMTLIALFVLSIGGISFILITAFFCSQSASVMRSVGAAFGIVLVLLGIGLADVIRKRRTGKNLERLGFRREGSGWTRFVGDAHLRAYHEPWWKYRPALVVETETKAPRGFYVNGGNLGNLTRSIGSEDAALVAKKMFDSGLVTYMLFLPMMKTRGRVDAAAKGYIGVDHAGPVSGMARIRLERRGLFWGEFKDSDIQAIADFFSALKRAGRR